MPRLVRTIFTAAAVDAGTGTPAIVAQTYCVLTTNALYIGAIAAGSGLLSQTTDTDYSEFPLLTIKEALRSGILIPQIVEVTAPAGTKTYRYTLYGSNSISAFPDGLDGATWPIGAAAGGKITDFVTATRVKSRT